MSQHSEPTPTDDELAILSLTAEVLATAQLRIERFEPRLRRLRRALHDLGLTATLGGESVQLATVGDAPADVVLRFDDLDSKAWDRLVCRLEDIAEQLPEVVSAPVPPTQLSLFDVIDFPGGLPGLHAAN